MTAWTFTIPRAIPSANAHIVNGNHRATAGKYRRFRNVWAQDFRTAALSLRIPAATAKRHVTITRLIGKGQREYDYDNLVAGSKAVVDAMKPPVRRRGVPVMGASLIVDDGPAHVLVTYLQERAVDGVAATRIVIEEVTP